MYYIIAIIAFGLLIATHELGHFIAAKLMNVRVIEFAIGMGPKLLKKQGKETLYSLRLLPFGGFCAMNEDEEAIDSRSFSAQKRIRRVFILAAGGIANFIFAFIIVVILVTQMIGFGGSTVVGFMDGFPNEGENGLMAGDTIVSINKERIYYSEDFSLFMGLAEGHNVDLIVKRGNDLVRLDDFPLVRREYTVNGNTRMLYGLYFETIENSFIEGFQYSCYKTLNFVRIVRLSLAQLFTGNADVTDMAGPVGMVDMMNTVGQSAPSVSYAIADIAGFVALIGVNIAVLNLLPIPAMDGGRIFFIFVTWAIEKITKRRLNPKYERYINSTALLLLIGLMVFILINDITRIVSMRS